MFFLRAQAFWVTLVWSVFLFPPLTAGASPVISEVMWMGTDLSTADEWLEIAAPLGSDCPSGGMYALSGVLLTVLNSSSVETTIVRFGSDKSIVCGGQIVLARNADSSSRLLEIPYLVVSSISLPNTKLLLRLFAPNGTLIDQADDGVGDPLAGVNPSGGVKASMERSDITLPGSDKNAWRTATEAKGFDTGSSVLGTPGYLEAGAGSSSAPIFSSSFSSLPSFSLSSSSASAAFSSFSSISWSESSQAAVQSSFSSSESSVQASSIVSASASSLLTGSSSENNEQKSYSLISLQPIIEAKNYTYSIRINEVMANPEGSDTEEWIEIQASGEGEMNLQGWTLSVSGSSVFYRVPSSINLSSALFEEKYFLFMRAQTGLSLDNKGKMIVLRNQSGALVDAFTYPFAEEGISAGRSTDNSQDILLQCFPTPGLQNQNRDPDVGIVLQSGDLADEDQTTVNLEARFASTTPSKNECFWDYQDGFQSASCNPPSHTFVSPGDYAVQLTARDTCGNTVVRTVDVHVYRGLVSSKTSGSSSSSATGSSSSAPGPTRSAALPVGTKVIIASVLPNPEGDDDGKEVINLRNDGSSASALDGWILRDMRAGKEWQLAGSIKASDVMHLYPHEKHWTLVNTSGSLVLLDPDGEQRSFIAWQHAAEGMVYSSESEGQETENSSQAEALVRRVIDGDSLEVALSDQWNAPKPITTIVRLRGIDAPELFEDRRKVSPIGLLAKNFIKALIEREKVVLKFDTEIQDISGRTLAYAFLGEIDIQEKLLQEGLARITSFAFSRREAYEAAQEKAQANRRGIWSDLRVKRFPIKKITRMQNNTPAYSSGPIYISEVYPYPKQGEGEWIELYNPNDVAMSMSGWILDDTVGGGSRPVFVTNKLSIQPQGYSIIFTEELGLKLNNDSDDIHLISPSNSFQDTVSYKKAKQSLSLSRAIPVTTNTLCPRQIPTPGQPNTCGVLAALKTTKVASAILGTKKKQPATPPAATSSQNYSPAPTPVHSTLHMVDQFPEPATSSLFGKMITKGISFVTKLLQKPVGAILNR